MRSNTPDPWSPQPEESFLKRIGSNANVPLFQRGRLLTVLTRIQLPLGILLFILPICLAAIPDDTSFCRIVSYGVPDLAAYMSVLGVAVVVSSFRVPRKAISTLWAFCATVALLSTSCFLWIIASFLRWELFAMGYELSPTRILLLYITIFVLSLLALTFLIELIVQSIRVWCVVKIYPAKDQIVKGWYCFIGGMGYLVSLGIITVSVLAALFTMRYVPILPYIGIKEIAFAGLIICTLPAPLSLAVFLVALGLRRRESWAWVSYLIIHSGVVGLGIYMLIDSMIWEQPDEMAVSLVFILHSGVLMLILCAKEGHLFPQWRVRVSCHKCGSSFRLRIGTCTICNGRLHLERTSMPYLDCHHCGAENVLAPVTCRSCGV